MPHDNFPTADKSSEMMNKDPEIKDAADVDPAFEMVKEKAAEATGNLHMNDTDDVHSASETFGGKTTETTANKHTDLTESDNEVIDGLFADDHKASASGVTESKVEATADDDTESEGDPDLTEAEAEAFEDIKSLVVDRMVEALSEAMISFVHAELPRIKNDVSQSVPLAAKAVTLNRYLTKNWVEIWKEDLEVMLDGKWWERVLWGEKENPVEEDKSAELDGGWLLVAPEGPAEGITKVDAAGQ